MIVAGLLPEGWKRKKGKYHEMEANAFVMIPKSVNKGAECILDMRPLVLCKDCVKRGTTDCILFKLCDGFVCVDDWFCADGERGDVRKA